jgi:UDP-N-acetylglucosamine acyltransferase
MSNVHPTAILGKNACLGEDVFIGPFTIIEDGVKIGDNTSVSSHVRISKGTTIGQKCSIYQGAVIGTQPQDLKFGGEESFVTIGNNTTIREYATINRATSDSYYTKVGDNCLLMAYSHIAHDCHLGNNVILANSVNLAGHVIIEDHVGIGGLTPVHQFTHIGTHCFIGGGLRVNKDVPPYIRAMGEPIQFGGLNVIGLKRRGFSEDTLTQLKNAFRLIYRENLLLEEAIQKLVDQPNNCPEVLHLINFLQKSERGIVR